MLVSFLPHCSTTANQIFTFCIITLHVVVRRYMLTRILKQREKESLFQLQINDFDTCKYSNLIKESHHIPFQQLIMMPASVHYTIFIILDLFSFHCFIQHLVSYMVKDSSQQQIRNQSVTGFSSATD